MFLVQYKDADKLKTGFLFIETNFCLLSSTFLFVARFITEFGEITNATRQIEAITLLLDLADQYVQSHSYWIFKSFVPGNGGIASLYDQNGNLELNKISLLSRYRI